MVCKHEPFVFFWNGFGGAQETCTAMAELKTAVAEPKTAVEPLTEKQENDIRACAEPFSRLTALHRTATVAFQAAAEATQEEEAIKASAKRRM